MHESCNYFQLFCYFHLENLHTFHVKYVKFVNQNFKIILKFCYPLKNILTDIHVLRANSIANSIACIIIGSDSVLLNFLKLIHRIVWDNKFFFQKNLRPTNHYVSDHPI